MNDFKSIFLPETNIDVSNYLCEILIFNYIKFKKYDMPSCPFWRKEYRTNKVLEELGRRYVVELVGIKQLMKKFPVEVIGNYFKDRKIFSYKLLRKHNQEKIRADLSELSDKFKKENEKIKIIKVDEVSTFTKTNTFQTKKGKLDL